MKKKSKKKSSLRLLFVIDPWETLDHVNDSTLRLVEEAIVNGAFCALAENRSISLDAGIPFAETTAVPRITRPRASENVVRGVRKWERIDSYDHVFYRTDPPVDLSYLLPLQMLASAQGGGKRKKPMIHSSPESLFFLNEKWAPAALGPLFPKSIVSSSTDRLVKFVESTGKSVLKPLYLAQSRGVEVLDPSVLSAATIRDRIRLSTQGEHLPIILQEFLPGILKGETRLWFSAGKLIASVKKVPKSGEAIIDMDQGGRIERVKLTARERKAVQALGPFLKKHRILFAAVDLIDGKITDFNHTSPGLLVAMEVLLGENIAASAMKPIFKA
jgi:glutathione synthase